MTMKHAIVFSLTLTVVCAMPPRAAAQFDLDLQATEIGNQLQEILNRITRYTTLLSQFTSLDCSAQGMAAGAEATPINEAAVVCDTLNMLGAFRDSYRQLLASAPTDLLNTARAVSRLARRVASRGYRHRGRYSERLPGQRRSGRGGHLPAPARLRGSQCRPGTCAGRCLDRTYGCFGRGPGRCCGS